jgi:hypothetical protein
MKVPQSNKIFDLLVFGQARLVARSKLLQATLVRFRRTKLNYITILNPELFLCPPPPYSLAISEQSKSG